MPNPPEDLENYIPEDDEVKILRPKYDILSGQCLGLVETLAYVTVQGNKCVFLVRDIWTIAKFSILHIK